MRGNAAGRVLVLAVLVGAARGQSCLLIEASAIASRVFLLSGGRAQPVRTEIGKAEPGLAAIPAVPDAVTPAELDAAASSLEPLIRDAAIILARGDRAAGREPVGWWDPPVELQIHGVSGMRRLSRSVQQQIYHHIGQNIETRAGSGLLVRFRVTMSTLDEQQQAFLSWVAANYLAGTLTVQPLARKSGRQLLGLIDIGAEQLQVVSPAFPEADVPVTPAMVNVAVQPEYAYQPLWEEAQRQRAWDRCHLITTGHDECEALVVGMLNRTGAGSRPRWLQTSPGELQFVAMSLFEFAQKRQHRILFQPAPSSDGDEKMSSLSQFKENLAHLCYAQRESPAVQHKVFKLHRLPQSSCFQTRLASAILAQWLNVSPDVAVRFRSGLNADEISWPLGFYLTKLAQDAVSPKPQWPPNSSKRIWLLLVAALLCCVGTCLGAYVWLKLRPPSGYASLPGQEIEEIQELHKN